MNTASIIKEPVADESLPQLPVSNYVTQIIKHAYAFYPRYKHDKDTGERIVLFHRIIEGSYSGLVLKQFCTKPNKFNSNYKYWQLYVVITGSRPTRGDRLPAKNLIGTICLSRVGFSSRKFKGTNILKPQIAQESQVLDIIEVLQRNGGTI